MILWLAVAVTLLALALFDCRLLYLKRKRGEVERDEVLAGFILILIAILIIAAAEFFYRPAGGLVFFLWVPFWFIWQQRRTHNSP